MCLCKLSFQVLLKLDIIHAIKKYIKIKYLYLTHIILIILRTVRTTKVVITMFHGYELKIISK